MATAAEAGMVAGSNVVSGAGTSSRTFTLPAAPLYRVESVVAHVDNTAGGDTTATLTYADTNGEVIAKKPQAGTIPAGNTGTATFALRLDDNAASALPTTAIRFNRDPQAGGFLVVTANGPPDASGYAVDVTVDNSESMRINVVGPGGSFEVTAPFFQLDANGGIMRFKDTSLFDVQATAFQHTGTDFAVFVANNVSLSASNDVSVTAGNDVSVTLGTAGTAVTVLDSGGNPIFRVNENGDLQGKTGKALVFNL